MNDSHRLIAALEDAGLKPRSYSGRGMSGNECVGVSAESAYAIGAALQDINAPEPQQDQLGKRYIFYWPSYPWPEKNELAVDNPVAQWKADRQNTIDITPRGCMTAEGTERVRKARNAWDDATHELANALQRVIDEIFDRNLDKIARAEYYSELQTLIGIRQNKQEEFLKAVAGR